MPHIRFLLAICLISVALTGCSTFEIWNRYQPVGDGHRDSEQLNDGVFMSLRFSPDGQFYSIGVLGLPIVPVHISFSDPDELSLELNLSFQQDIDFSIPQSLCIVFDDQQQLCPDVIDLRALGMYQDSGAPHKDGRPRWQNVPAFHNKPHLIRKLQSGSENRISRDDIYLHYGYTGGVPWNSMIANIRYHYTCPDTCPKRFTVGHQELLTLQGRSIGARLYTFEMQTDKAYHFTRNVQ